MANTGFNKNGGVVNVGDHVSITAKVVSYTGSGSNAAVTAQAPLDSGTISIRANDANAVEQPSDSLHTAVSFGGNYYGVAGDDLTILGVVTAISHYKDTDLLSLQSHWLPA